MAFEKVITTIEIILEDSTTPRAVREKLMQMQRDLISDADAQSKISRAQSELEELASDVNIPPYVRTQLYAVASRLEEVGN